MRNLQIRNLTEKDIKNLEKFLQKHFPSWAGRVRKEFFNPKINYKLATTNKEILGAISYMTIDHETEIHLLVVDKNYRNKGIGTQLLKKLIEELKDKKVKHIFLEVSNRNNPAIKLYKKAGFKQIGLRKNYYGKGEHGIVMMLKIEKKEVKDVQRREPERTCTEKISSLCNT